LFDYASRIFINFRCASLIIPNALKSLSVWRTGNKVTCKKTLYYAVSQKTELVPEPDAGFSHINANIAGESTNRDHFKIPDGNCRDLSFCEKKYPDIMMARLRSGTRTLTNAKKRLFPRAVFLNYNGNYIFLPAIRKFQYSILHGCKTYRQDARR
jgi:hypothetical protein